MKFFGLLLLPLSILLTSCTTKEQVSKIISDNPDIVFKAMEKDPMRFAEAMQAASVKARAQMQAKADEENKKKREEELKNPKNPVIGDDRASRGKKDAAITIVEYSDFQCPYCKRGYETVEEVRKKYGDKIRFVYKHLPLPFHEMAMPAARYFEAIALQNGEKAYQFHDKVFSNQDKLNSGKEAFLKEMAKAVGANDAQLKKDLTSAKVTERIEADTKEANSFGINGTPGFIVGGVTLAGAYPAPAFEEIIEARLAATRGTAAKETETK